MIIYDSQGNAEANRKEGGIARFHFPRQDQHEHLCLADYFASVKSGKVDVVAFQVVTMGQAASEAVHRLQQAGNYAEAYFTHVLGVEMAEGLAEYTNRVVCQELGLAGQRGRRYTWGYPDVPALETHVKCFQLFQDS